MRKEVKDKWLAALRSGEYKQGKNQLIDGDNYCCLGVLCDIHSKTVKKKGVRFKDNMYFDGIYYNTIELTERVQKWAGINSELGTFKYKNGKQSSLASLNDDKGKSFKEIANIIEKYF